MTCLRAIANKWSGDSRPEAICWATLLFSARSLKVDLGLALSLLWGSAGRHDSPSRFLARGFCDFAPLSFHRRQVLALSHSLLWAPKGRKTWLTSHALATKSCQSLSCCIRCVQGRGLGLEQAGDRPDVSPEPGLESPGMMGIAQCPLAGGA